MQFIDVRFCDLPGIMQHFTFPASNFGESVFTDGLMFDGSSIRGFQQIHESDMLLLPDPTTAYMDPFRQHPTLIMNFFIHDPLTGEAYSRDPRNIAKKAEDYLRGSGIADTTYFGPEAEFYIFDDVRYDQTPHSAYHYIDSVEGAWNSGREEPGGNKGYKPRYKGGYFPVPPTDHFTDLRSEMVRVLLEIGIDVEMQHHEVGHGRPGRDRLPVRHAAQDRRQPDELQVRREERRAPARPDRDLHAEADLHGQRLGHALPPVAVEGRRAAVLRRDRLRRPFGHGAALHRRVC